MFAVIFEVQPRKQRFGDYLGLAKLLKPELEKIDGFIDNERFESTRIAGRILSLSTWRDEKSVIRWRTLAIHHDAQVRGRSEIFDEYHLRVGEITADSHLPPGHRIDEYRFDETETGPSRCATISELVSTRGSRVPALLPDEVGLPAIGSAGMLGQEMYASLTIAGKSLLLAAWTDPACAQAWHPAAPAGDGLRHRQVRIIRDYGMQDRREAPQYYPPVKGI
jgi:heme-degrading monooxygenase HmoA